ncbi:hypothetical protein KDA_38570 [Dictyobacter alpinus]|uniref:Uncharacterized protein n=1 Tax=Dictyobacter alpinus TaxID=2014873 RepID=A0A402BAF7_9CHLR|nr:hypothetical protein KDA_38570 [Dictyobacter alpinus]
MENMVRQTFPIHAATSTVICVGATALRLVHARWPTKTQQCGLACGAHSAYVPLAQGAHSAYKTTRLGSNVPGMV